MVQGNHYSSKAPLNVAAQSFAALVTFGKVLAAEFRRGWTATACQLAQKRLRAPTEGEEALIEIVRTQVGRSETIAGKSPA